MQKLTHGATRPPGYHVVSTCQFSFMKTAQQGEHYVAILRMKVIVWAIEVRRHYTMVITVVLAVVTFTEFDASDLGNGIMFVSGFQRAG